MPITRRASLFCLAALGTWMNLPPAHSEARAESRRIALQGYDPVSYFETGRPQKGNAQFSYAFDDVVYLFSSASHRDLFSSDPVRYAPQYEAYCAAGISEGHKAEPDPEAFVIADGKLFVFHDRERVSAFRSTIREIDGKAKENWPSVREQ